MSKANELIRYQQSRLHTVLRKIEFRIIMK